MTRESQLPHTVAILATGDEVIQGDIFNSNSREIALRLANAGMNIRTHMAVPDSIREIEEAIRFLLQTHDALIITGGLGPTSDDLTRFALAKVLEQELVFDEKTWEDICARLKRFGYPTPPDSNRQQALFPKDAIIIHNPNGTAAGCFVEHQQHFIFMLPGPPSECLPMVDAVVLTTLQRAQFQHLSHHKNWFLFGVSEGKIAEELDLLANPYQCVTGYRLFYPYIEFKLRSNHREDFEKLSALVEKTIQPYLIGDGQQIASQRLQQKLADADITLNIWDHATGGALQAAILTPKTNSHLKFFDARTDVPQIEIRGLQEFWLAKDDATHTHLEIIFTHQNQQHKIENTVPFRGKRVLNYAVEFICWQVLEMMGSSR